MSVSLREVIEHAGYYFENKEDCEWFLSKQSEIEELVEFAEEQIEAINEAEEAEREKEENG